MKQPWFFSVAKWLFNTFTYAHISGHPWDTAGKARDLIILWGASITAVLLKKDHRGKTSRICGANCNTGDREGNEWHSVTNGNNNNYYNTLINVKPQGWGGGGQTQGNLTFSREPESNFPFPSSVLLIRR